MKHGASACVVGKGGKINPREDDGRSEPPMEANTSSKKNAKKDSGGKEARPSQPQHQESDLLGDETSAEEGSGGSNPKAAPAEGAARSKQGLCLIST